MKRRGRQVLLLLPLSILLLAFFVNAATTAEVAQETTPKTDETISKQDPIPSTKTISKKPVTNRPEVTTKSTVPNLSFENAEDFAKILANPKKVLMQEISTLDKHKSAKSMKNYYPSKKLIRPILDPKDIADLQSLDEDVNDKRIQETVTKVIKAQAQKTRPRFRTSTTAVPSFKSDLNKETESQALSDLEQAEANVTYDDNIDETGDDDDSFDEDDEDEDDDDDDDDDEYDDDDDNIEDEEEIMTQCPDYCRCSGQYAEQTTARCSKLIGKQKFGSDIAHLNIENAGEIILGPHALSTRGLQRLESITIVDTDISSIDRTAFDGVPYIFAVNLSRNGIIDIHPDTFQNNSGLSLLTISGHPFSRNWTINRDYLLEAPNVTELDLSWNSMPRLPKSAFSKMPKLVYLDLKQNRLSKVEKELFEPLESLLELDLSANMISHLPGDVFSGIDLENLRISDNELTSLATINASKLTTLDASTNRIKIIARNDLAGVPSLNQLIISYNGLKKIHEHAFSHLDELNHLDISNNNLESLTEHHLRNNRRLQILLMNDNPVLGILPIFMINGLQYNAFSVYRFECAHCGLEFLEEGTFTAMPALNKLNLARNRLTGLPKGLLEPLSSLTELDLSDNLISHIPPNMLNGAVTLSKLNLAGNPLVTLQVTPFLQSPGLSRLDVSRCQLERVWSEARQHLKSLRFLSVRGNELERITLEELKATPELSGLDISQNPIICDDEFSAAIQWLTDHKVNPNETIKYISNLRNSNGYTETEGLRQWSDFIKLVCVNVDGPPPRPIPHKPTQKLPLDEDEKAAEISKDDLEADIRLITTLDHGQRIDENVEEAWLNLDNTEEYEDYDGAQRKQSVYRSWYGGPVWPILTVALVTLSALLIIIQSARSLANRRGRGPVIRPPMILRQGLVDNKNCGLVYKPLQEEIATPHMPKRGSFYSSSTFHYDKIVPESV